MTNSFMFHLYQKRKKKSRTWMSGSLSCNVWIFFLTSYHLIVVLAFSVYYFFLSVSKTVDSCCLKWTKKKCASQWELVSGRYSQEWIVDGRAKCHVISTTIPASKVVLYTLHIYNAQKLSLDIRTSESISCWSDFLRKQKSEFILKKKALSISPVSQC